MWLSSMVAGAISDRLVNSGRVSADWMRKVMNTIAHYGAAGGLVWLAFVGCDRTMAIVALCIAMGLNGCAFSGFMVRSLVLVRMRGFKKIISGFFAGESRGSLAELLGDSGRDHEYVLQPLRVRDSGRDRAHHRRKCKSRISLLAIILLYCVMFSNSKRLGRGESSSSWLLASL